MSWMSKLCETYDYAIARGAAFNKNNPLPEMGFKLENVEAQIRLNEKGEFLDITMIPKEQQSMPVPATPDSITARGEPVKPHPIFDKVKDLCTDEQLSILSEWCSEDDCPEDVKIIFSYLSKKTLSKDVERAFEEKGVKNDPQKTFVSFIVSESLIYSRAFCDSWKNHFIRMRQDYDMGLCYVTGEENIITKKHPFATKNLMLISMTDENCKGRFEGEAKEALSIGLETTLKAHSARKWLMNRQGRYLHGMEFVAWDTYDFDTVSPIDNCGYSYENEEVITTGEADANELATATGGIWSAKIKEINDSEFDELSTIVVMALDSPTGKGRVSITYYQEFDPKAYVDNLLNWYSSCIWIRRDTKLERDIAFTPSLYDICGLVYGERNDSSVGKLKRRLCKDLLPCITAKKPIQDSIITAGFTRLINPYSFKSDKSEKWNSFEWEKYVAILCAMINKKLKENGEEIKMILDEKETDRDYLYGRLLAIADTIEHIAMTNSGDSSGRMTNAMRYMQRFVQRPAETWLMLRTQKLTPYLERLSTGSKVYYEKLMNDIQGSIDTEGYISDKPLGPRFLQGYSLQKSARNTRTDKNDNKEE